MAMNSILSGDDIKKALDAFAGNTPHSSKPISRADGGLLGFSLVPGDCIAGCLFSDFHVGYSH